MRPLAAFPGIRVIVNGDVWQTSSPPAVATDIMGEVVIVAEVNSIARLGRPGLKLMLNSFNARYIEKVVRKYNFNLL